LLLLPQFSLAEQPEHLRFAISEQLAEPDKLQPLKRQRQTEQLYPVQQQEQPLISQLKLAHLLRSWRLLPLR
jgi:hypothetical protein